VHPEFLAGYTQALQDVGETIAAMENLSDEDKGRIGWGLFLKVTLGVNGKYEAHDTERPNVTAAIAETVDGIIDCLNHLGGVRKHPRVGQTVEIQAAKPRGAKVGWGYEGASTVYCLACKPEERINLLPFYETDLADLKTAKHSGRCDSCAADLGPAKHWHVRVYEGASSAPYQDDAHATDALARQGVSYWKAHARPGSNITKDSCTRAECQPTGPNGHRAIVPAPSGFPILTEGEAAREALRPPQRAATPEAVCGECGASYPYTGDRQERPLRCPRCRGKA
jgi:hypothetical protein